MMRASGVRGGARWLAQWVGLAGVLLAAGLPACAVFQPGSADEMDRERVVEVRERVVRDLIVVQFGNLAVSPQTVHLKPDERVVWSNHSDYVAQVVFPAGFSQSLRCDHLGDEWQRTEQYLASNRIAGGRLDLLLPCGLAPGSYYYEIYLFSREPSAEAAGQGVDDPELRLTARLLVQ